MRDVRRVQPPAPVTDVEFHLRHINQHRVRAPHALGADDFRLDDVQHKIGEGEQPAPGLRQPSAIAAVRHRHRGACGEIAQLVPTSGEFRVQHRRRGEGEVINDLLHGGRKEGAQDSRVRGAVEDELELLRVLAREVRQAHGLAGPREHEVRQPPHAVGELEIRPQRRDGQIIKRRAARREISGQRKRRPHVAPPVHFAPDGRIRPRRQCGARGHGELRRVIPGERREGAQPVGVEQRHGEFRIETRLDFRRERAGVRVEFRLRAQGAAEQFGVQFPHAQMRRAPRSREGKIGDLQLRRVQSGELRGDVAGNFFRPRAPREVRVRELHFVPRRQGERRFHDAGGRAPFLHAAAGELQFRFRGHGPRVRRGDDAIRTQLGLREARPPRLNLLAARVIRGQRGQTVGRIGTEVRPNRERGRAAPGRLRALQLQIEMRVGRCPLRERGRELGVEFEALGAAPAGVGFFGGKFHGRVEQRAGLRRKVRGHHEVAARAPR